MRKKCIVTVLAMIFSLFVLTAGGVAGELDAFKGQRGTLKISGGTAHIPVMKEAAQRIMSAYPDIQISIAAGDPGSASSRWAKPGQHREHGKKTD
jgi:phosphate transport system substrate-binding protein